LAWKILPTGKISLHEDLRSMNLIVQGVIPPARRRGSEPFAMAKEVFRVVKDIKFNLRWTLVFIAWALAVLIVWAIRGIYTSEPLEDTLFIVLINTALLIWAIGLFSLYNVIRGIRTLDVFEDNYFTYAYLSMFDFTPSNGKNTAEEVVERLEEIHTDMKVSISKDPSSVRYNVLAGRGEAEKFDAVIEFRVSGSRWLWWKNSAVFVKVVENGNAQVEPDLLEDLARNVRSLAESEKADVFRVVLITQVGYSDATIEYVSRAKEWAGNEDIWRALVLLKKGEFGYQIAWMPRLSLPGRQ